MYFERLNLGVLEPIWSSSGYETLLEIAAMVVNFDEEEETTSQPLLNSLDFISHEINISGYLAL